MKMWSFLGGLGGGVGLMYYFDPLGGGGRRSQLRGKLVRGARDLADGIDTAARDLAHRARGLEARTRRRGRRERPTDGVLETRVRQAVARTCSHPRALAVKSQEGVVELAGPILRADLEGVLGAARKVPGVTELHAALEVHDEPGHVPALQGPGRAPRPQKVTPAERLLAGAAGLALSFVGLTRGGLAGAAFGLAGLGLASRGLLGGRSAAGGFTVRKTIHVDAPVDEVWSLWARFESFPRFMAHVCEVRATGDRRYHWIVTTPLGLYEWDAEVTTFRTNEELAWRTIRGSSPGSSIRHEGRVRVRPDRRGGTELRVDLVYTPPAGALGHGLARLFGADPKKQMDDDLLRFKSLVEKGRATGRRTVSREEVGGRAARGLLEEMIPRR